MKSKSNKKYSYYGKSESGDFYGPFLSSEKLTREEEYNLVHNWDGHFGRKDGWVDGPGSYGSYVYLKVKEAAKD